MNVSSFVPLLASVPRFVRVPFGVLGIALVLSALGSGDASAQRIASKTSGLLVGAHLVGASLKVEDADRSNGAGGGAVVGWVFGNGVGVFGQFDRSNVDVRNQPGGTSGAAGSWSVTKFDAGIRYYFRRPQATVVPFLQAAGTYRDVRVDEVQIISPGPVDVLDLSGFGGTAGAGVNLHVVPTVAFEFSLVYSIGTLENAEVDGQEVTGFEGLDAQTGRFTLGLTWWPVG